MSGDGKKTSHWWSGAFGGLDTSQTSTRVGAVLVAVGGTVATQAPNPWLQLGGAILSGIGGVLVRHDENAPS